MDHRLVQSVSPSPQPTTLRGNTARAGMATPNSRGCMKRTVSAGMPRAVIGAAAPAPVIGVAIAAGAVAASGADAAQLGGTDKLPTEPA